MATCQICRYAGNTKDKQPCADCIGYSKYEYEKPQTNADRIRAMSDEELAELFDGIVDNGRSCSLICGDLDNCKRNNSIERICKNHYLKWLKQPAEGE